MTATTKTTKAPPSDAEVVRAFANTLDPDTGADDLESAASFAAWLVAQGTPGAQVSADDLDLARRLRAALRAELAAHDDAHHGCGPDIDSCQGDPRAELEAVAADLPLALSFDGTRPGLRAACGGAVRDHLAVVVAAIVSAAGSGAWDRLKICCADDCRWAFYDQSRNRSRRWCSMEVCGNRNKTRAYRARSRDDVS